MMPVDFPRKLFLTDIKSFASRYGFLLEPLFALAEYDIFFLRIVPSFSYLINTIFPERGFIGPLKSIASDKHASRGSLTTPGFSTLPKRFTEINLGESPLRSDLGCWSLALRLSFEKTNNVENGALSDNLNHH